jgi:hypothetical protein
MRAMRDPGISDRGGKTVREDKGGEQIAPRDALYKRRTEARLRSGFG